MLSVLLLGACTMRHASPSSHDSERIAVRFGVDVPNFTPMRVVGLDENAIGSLELWVFDRDGHFLERAIATNITPDGGKYTFEAMMTPAPDGCIIHFVANKSFSGDPLNFIGRDEAEVLFAVSGNSEGGKMTMWARKEFTTPIAENTDLGEVQLIRNMVKFGLVVNSPKLQEVTYALYRTWDKGSIAPFNPDKLATNPFDTNDMVPTEPAGVAYADYSSNWLSADGSAFHYGYERKNKDAAEIACLIIKAKYDGDTSYSYYKIDFVNTDKVRYDLIRNHFFKVTINDVRQRGYASVNAALAGTAANNLALSEQIQMYPTFSDGKGQLDVERTFFVFVNNEPSFTFRADYIPDVINNPTVKANERITLTSTGDAINGTPTHDSNGTITVPLRSIPADGSSLTSDLVLGVNDNVELKRLVRIVVRPQFDFAHFKMNNEETLSKQVTAAQNTPLTFEVTLPEEFSARLLPMTFRVFTEHFYPSNHEGFTFGYKNGTFYAIEVSSIPADRKLTWHFKSNKGASAESIKIECVEQYFRTVTATVTN